MPTRIWLDATSSNDSSVSQHAVKNNYRQHNAAIPPVPALPASPPVIPPRHSPALTSSTLDSKSRSAQSKSRPKAHRRDISDRTHHQYAAAAPPEVIGNLIDSLATVSFPDPIAGEHSSPRVPNTDQLPDAPIVSTIAHSPRLARRSRSFDTLEQKAVRSALNGHFTGIDDAAEPPIVRTTKSPSSWSQSFSNKLSKFPNVGNGGLGINSGLDSPTGSSNRGNASFQSIGSLDGGPHSPSNKSRSRRQSSLGNPSSETLDSSVSPTKRSFKWTPQGSIKRKAPRSVAAQGLVNELRLDALKPDDPVNTIDKKAASSSRINEAMLEENNVTRVTPLPFFTGSKKEEKKAAKSPRASPAIVQGPTVPNRRSSLRPQEFPELGLPLEDLAPITSTPKTVYKKHDREAKLHSTGKDEDKSLTGHDMLSGHDTEVTKRIKELKAKKEMRDREARNSPSPDVQVSLLTNRNAHRGVTEPSGAPKNLLANIRVPQISKGNCQTTPDDDDAAPPLTPLTPMNLPINYSFVVQSLNEDEPRPLSRSDPYLEAPPTRPLSRPQSVGAIMNPSIPKPSVVKSFWSRKETVLRAMTPERANDVLAYDCTTREGKPQNRRSTSINSKRKRWSQSDLNDTRINESSREAIRETVYEERQTNQDNIDRAVEKFIHAQRLSQKIRHPGTGRVISFSEVGNPKGNVVFCCVGMGLTRFVTAFYDELASTLNLRLITPDRPGVGNSEVDQNGTPLSWPDDVLLICTALNVNKFSILAHSAGAIYALATALRVPQHIRGKVHLLAPWIPPSQMETIGTHQGPPPPGAQLPKSQRLLRVLPAPLLKVANSSFLSATSASLSPNLGSPAGRKKKKNTTLSDSLSKSSEKQRLSPNRPQHTRRESIMLMDQQSMPRTSHGIILPPNLSGMEDAFMTDGSHSPLTVLSQRSASLQHNGFQTRSVSKALSPITDSFSEPGSPMVNDPGLLRLYDERLTLAIWAAATTAANPAVDLLVCLERSHSIGFRYVDITRSVVIHHGAKDSRVPVDNVKWLGGMMRRCEVRVLEGESHGLMASASVMGGVLTEMAKEWHDWDKMISRSVMRY